MTPTRSATCPAPSTPPPPPPSLSTDENVRVRLNDQTDRLEGRSGLAAVAQYEWPIWVWLNGALHVAAGNVFDRHFDHLDLDKLRFSGGLGLRTSGIDYHFELLVAAGTAPFDEGAAFEAVRVVFGGSHAF